MRVFARQSGRMLAAKNAEREHQEKIEEARDMKERGYSNSGIALKLGVAESTVRRMLRDNSV